MYNNMVMNCSSCYTPLQLPPGSQSIRCVVCQAVTPIQSNFYGWDVAPSPNYGGPVVPSPYNHTVPNAYGNKKAVLIGISYMCTNHALKGCVNDAKCMRFLLTNKFGFPEASILMLTEEESDPSRIPTGNNIRMAMKWLVQGCQPGDSLVFHYSGHGSRQRNISGDEIDGYDETLCPVDFETQGMIIDDEINSILVRPLPHGVKLHSIIDACHSGTVLDLPYLCRMNINGVYVWEDHRPPSGVWKGTSGGEVISISGCDDHQTSADTSALSKVTSTGAMTFCLIQAIEHSYANGMTYGSLLNAMRATLVAGTGGICSGGFKQEPQLTSCETFDVYNKSFFF